MQYFGRIASDVRGEAALARWLDVRDDLLSGRTPRATTDDLTVADSCNRFLTAKERQRDAGDIKAKTFKNYGITSLLSEDVPSLVEKVVSPTPGLCIPGVVISFLVGTTSCKHAITPQSGAVQLTNYKDSIVNLAIA